MKILFLTNDYPLLEGDGYERLCHDIEERMLRGHQVKVLANDRAVGSRLHSGPPLVLRDLPLYFAWCTHPCQK